MRTLGHVILGIIGTVFCLLGAVAMVSLLDMVEVGNATKQAQTYMEHKAVGSDITVQVEDCVKLPSKVKGHKSNWACRVTATSGEELETEIMQFTPDNLAGKLDPVQPRHVQPFDHSKDSNI